jgi:hypothetical protein
LIETAWLPLLFIVVCALFVAVAACNDMFDDEAAAASKLRLVNVDKEVSLLRRLRDGGREEDSVDAAATTAACSMFILPEREERYNSNRRDANVS